MKSMPKQLTLYLFCSIFIYISMSQRSDRPFPNTIHKRCSKKSIARAYLLGEKCQLTRKQKRSHKKLQLLHLLTPSGLHLSAFIFFLRSFLKRKFIFFVIILIYGFSFWFGGLFSLKRMCLLFIIAKLRNKFDFKTLIIGFTLDAILGGFYQNPLSWTLSLLFLGTILIQRYESYWKLILGLIGAQCLVSLFFNQNFYLFGSFFGFIITLIFPYFFPTFILQELIPSFSYPSDIFLKIIEFLSQYSGPSFSIFFILTLICLFLNFSKQIIYCGIILLSLFSTSNLENLPKSKQKKAPFPFPPPQQFSKKIEKKWGTLFYYDNLLICRSRLFRDSWSTHCRK